MQAVNSSLLTDRRAEVIAKIDGHIAALKQDMVTVQGDADLRAACVKPFDTLREDVQRQNSLAHITQAEGGAARECDAAVGRIEDFCREVAKQTTTKDDEAGTVFPSPPTVKRQRIVTPADLVKTTYLETSDDVKGFLGALRQTLNRAIDNNERIQIR